MLDAVNGLALDDLIIRLCWCLNQHIHSDLQLGINARMDGLQ